MHLYGKVSFNCKTLARNEKMDRKFMVMNIFWPQGVDRLCPSAIYMIIIFKDLLLCSRAIKITF